MSINMPTLVVRVAGALLALLVVTFGAGLQAQNTSSKFDHLQTGFPLTGAHVSARCESCHVGGVLKGTPRDCASCHTSGLRLARNNVVKPQQHVASALGCDSCHTTRSSSVPGSTMPACWLALARHATTARRRRASQQPIA